MVAFANIILPLYIWPTPGAWDPLIQAARRYPLVNFTTVINPYSGPYPAANGCPPAEYVQALAAINHLPNINTMGYVHTANKWDCGPSQNWICSCTAPIAEVKTNISVYAAWSRLICDTSRSDIHIDSIFIDEAPNLDNGSCLPYMSELATFARTELGTTRHPNIVMFNAGGPTDLRYFDLVDQIVILENTQEEFENIPDIDSLNGDGLYYDKSSVIIYAHDNSTQQLRMTTDVVLSLRRNAFPSLFITDLRENQYQSFSPGWMKFVAEVDQVARSNRQIMGS